MNMISVSSSNLVAIGYDSESNTLRVEFHAGRTYEYLNVPRREYEALRTASSHGEYLARHIKDKYQYVQV